jgi:hypothetical protein
MNKMLKVFIIILVIVIASFSWSWFHTKKKLDDYVHKVQPGMQLTEVRTYARQMGVKYVVSSHRDEAGHFSDLVTASGVMGRYVCEVQHDGTVVIQVTKRFHD